VVWILVLVVGFIPRICRWEWIWRGCRTDTPCKYCCLDIYYKLSMVSPLPFSLPWVLWASPTFWSWVFPHTMQICAGWHCLSVIVLVCKPCEFTSFLLFDLWLELGGLIHVESIPRLLGVMVELIYWGDKGLGAESMVGIVGVGAIITRRSVCFPSLYGVPITHSVVFLTFRTRW